MPLRTAQRGGCCGLCAAALSVAVPGPFGGSSVLFSSSHSLKIALARYAVLRDADLSRADLHGATMHGAYLSGANLMFADLIGADLYGAKLRYASLAVYGGRPVLSFADLTGAKYAVLQFFKGGFEQRNPRALTDLSGVNLGGADLTGADLTGAKSKRSDLVRRQPDQGVLLDYCHPGTCKGLRHSHEAAPAVARLLIELVLGRRREACGPAGAWW